MRRVVLLLILPVVVSVPSGHAVTPLPDRWQRSASFLFLGAADLDGVRGQEVVLVEDVSRKLPTPYPYPDLPGESTRVVHALDPRDGRTRWAREFTTSLRPPHGGAMVLLGDLTGDRAADVLVAHERTLPTGKVTFLTALDGRSGATAWERRGGAYVAAGLPCYALFCAGIGASADLLGDVWLIDDMDGDGGRDVFAESHSTQVVHASFVSGRDGRTIASFATISTSLQPVRDVSGDGKPDVLGVSWLADTVSAYSDDGAMLWSRKGKPFALELGRFDRDAQPEILMQETESPTSSLVAVDGRTGRTDWRATLGPHVRVVGDADGDRIDDLLFDHPRDPGSLFVLRSGRDRRVIWRRAAARQDPMRFLEEGETPSFDANDDRVRDVFTAGSQFNPKTGEVTRHEQEVLDGATGRVLWRPSWVVEDPERRNFLVRDLGRRGGHDFVTLRRRGSHIAVRAWSGDSGSVISSWSIPLPIGRWYGTGAATIEAAGAKILVVAVESYGRDDRAHPVVSAFSSTGRTLWTLRR